MRKRRVNRFGRRLSTRVGFIQRAHFGFSHSTKLSSKPGNIEQGICRTCPQSLTTSTITIHLQYPQHFWFSSIEFLTRIGTPSLFSDKTTFNQPSEEVTEKYACIINRITCHRDGDLDSIEGVCFSEFQLRS